MLFWADDNYRQNKSWYDNILVAWKMKATKNQDNQIVETPDNTKLVPAHLHLFFNLKMNLPFIVSFTHVITEQINYLFLQIYE